jgi:hypothetical protein
MSTLSDGDEIEERFYQLKAQEWAVSFEQAKELVEAALRDVRIGARQGVRQGHERPPL